MKQLDMIHHLATVAARDGAIVVSEIGSQTQWLYASGDRPNHLYLSGPMGMAPSVALGVALAQPQKPVLAICGDGSLAMNLNALTTIAHMAPKNLTLAVMNNGVYELTGQVPTPTARTNWQALAKSLGGFAQVSSVDTKTPLAFTATNGLTLWEAKLAVGTEKAPSFPLTPEEVHRRFKAFLHT